MYGFSQFRMHARVSDAETASRRNNTIAFRARVAGSGASACSLGMAALFIGIFGLPGVTAAQNAATSSAPLAVPGAPGAPVPPEDQSLTMHGITLYGIVDLGLQYQQHGAPISDYALAGSNDLIQKNSNNSILGAVPSNMSQSRIGLQGKEPLVGDWSGVFKLETFFNPQSGELGDGLKSLTLNNGRALTAQKTGLDVSAAGELFGGAAYTGVSSPTYGTLTFGRQNGLLADGIFKYDPMMASTAFSLIGFAGGAAGGGYTQDRRLDSSLKYALTYAGLHVGGQYKFNASSGAASSALEFQLGGEFAGASIDGFYTKIKDAVSAASLSASQVAGLPALGFSSSNSLSATVSDNQAFGIMGQYVFGTGAPAVYAGYEHIRFENPSTPLAPGYSDIGGYILAYINNDAYANDKIQQIYWIGGRYPVTTQLDLIAAYYGLKQNSYASGADSGCSDIVSAACSGTERIASFVTDYRLSQRFDVYAGIAWSKVADGVASGYLNTSNINPTIGLRFKF
jgi:predicted porin